MTECLQEKQELIALLEEKQRRTKYRKIDTLFTDDGYFGRQNYGKHIAFFESGASFRERLLCGGNGTGKTTTGACEFYWHMSGLYPSWWEGKRFKKGPLNAWVASIGAEQMKSAVQEVLFGPFNDRGTGVIPLEDLGQLWNMPGVPNCVGTAEIKHYTNGKFDGYSKAEFKTYEQGWGKFQGSTRDLIWLDEEPEDQKVYSECISRTRGGTGKEGILFMTFTPLLGMSDVVLSFCPDGDIPVNGFNPKNPSKWAIKIGWDDIPYEQMSKEYRESTLLSYRPHEREARTKGVPYLGAGAVFPYNWDDISCEPFEIPLWYECAYGLDVGWNRTAAVWGAVDPNSNITYIWSEYSMGEQIPEIHALAIKARDKVKTPWMTGAIDPGSKSSSQADGKCLFNMYCDTGLNLAIADNSRETSIFELQQAFQTGRLKIFNTCLSLRGDLRKYHRDDKGEVKDAAKFHIIDALRYYWMTGRQWGERYPDIDSGKSSYSYSTGRNPVTGY